MDKIHNDNIRYRLNLTARAIPLISIKFSLTIFFNQLFHMVKNATVVNVAQ